MIAEFGSDLTGVEEDIVAVISVIRVMTMNGEDELSNRLVFVKFYIGIK